MAEVELTRINTNIAALNMLNALTNINRNLSIHQLRLATGKRINQAADDAAGLTIASKLKVRAEGLGVALNNVADAKNMVAVAEGNLTKILDILGQMKAKATQAANDTLGSEERAAINKELAQLAAQIDDEVTQATWNGVPLLSGDSTSFVFQVGAATTDVLTFDLKSSEVGYTGGYTAVSLSVDQGGGTVTIGTASDYYVAPGAYTLTAIAASATINTGATQLNEGFYTFQVVSVTEEKVKYRVLDAYGSPLQISSTSNGTGALATSAEATLDEGATATIDTGRGFKFQLGDLEVDDTGSFVFKLDKAGNNVNDHDSAVAYMSQIDAAITNVNKALSYIGARVNRMTAQEENLMTAKVNTEAAHNRIMHADLALEQLEASKLLILQQTATAMLAQANVGPQAVLALFR
ncbi:MAG: flagellin [bacterium]|jgi:flagellin|nr:flagellin [candidate division KSB1 bacterium]MDH7559308.1 flagellin [bacterium]